MWVKQIENFSNRYPRPAGGVGGAGGGGQQGLPHQQQRGGPGAVQRVQPPQHRLYQAEEHHPAQAEVRQEVREIFQSDNNQSFLLLTELTFPFSRRQSRSLIFWTGETVR